MEFVKYTTKEGDRWDTIAFSQYGDPLRLALIIDANPTVPVDVVLPGGLVLNIPIISRADAQTDTARLPPWKR